MQFVTRANGHSVALTMGVSDNLLNFIPADLTFSGVMLGRIKGTGISIKGLEFLVLVTTPTAAIVFGGTGARHWRTPLAGLTAIHQGLDSVRFVAADGSDIKFITGFPPRAKIIRHLFAAELNARGLGGPAGSTF